MHMTNLASIQLILWNILLKYEQNPEDIFRKVGLNPALMHQAGKRYPVGKTDELWLEADRRISDPCFGLVAAESWHPSYLGTLGYAMLASTSLRIALARLIRFHQVVSDVRFGHLSEDPETNNLVFALAGRESNPPSPALEDATIALIMNILRMNYQKDIAPVTVTFRHHKPECSSRYYEFFKSPVQFDSLVTSLTLPLDIIDRTLPSGNEEVAEVNEHLMTKYIATLDNEHLVTKIKRLIVEYLPSGKANLETIAAQFYTSTRTLQRHLQQEGTSFAALVDETRSELARQYVQEKDMDLSEIAFLLGFSEQGALSRSFKRWTGKSPVHYRKSLKL